MLGFEGIATVLTQRLRERGPQAARVVEEYAGLREGTIRLPETENIHPVWIDVVSKGRFPSWMVVAQDTPVRRTVRNQGTQSLEHQTQWRYPFIVVSHVEGGNEYELSVARYRLMLVVRTILFQEPLLLKRGKEKAEMDLDDMQEITGGIAQDPDGQRYLMEGRNEFHVRTTEVTPNLAPDRGPASIRHDEHLMNRRP